MSAFENRLVFACNQVRDAAAETLEWITDNERVVGTERVSLLHEFSRTEVAASNLAAAVCQPPAVAFIGATRSGKTHTITSMIERSGGRLVMRFDGIRERIDFLRNIVPESGRFGASMVLRLSEHEHPRPQNFPIAMRLLSMAEVVKILGNAYFAAKGKRARVPSLAEVRAVNAEASRIAGEEPVPGLTEEDVWDIKSYFTARFGEEPMFRALFAAGYWQAVARLAPVVPNEMRARLFSLLWGGLEPFSEGFVLLANAVASLGGGLDANCALDAILSIDPRTGKFSRRADSIINGETTAALGIRDERTVVVCNEFGHWVSMPRTALAALAAEVRLPLPQESSEVTRNADFLEFPGLDNRQTVNSLESGLDKDATLLGRLFLRAKAVHLVDLYAAQHKITSMVVCIDHAHREVGELAPAVANWVELTHGRDAVTREHHDNSLFLAFTKIDKEFADGARTGKDQRLDWSDRIGHILLDGFGRDHDWPRVWTPGRPFDNIHLIRNPNHRAKQILDYSSDGQELGFKAGQLERIERSRQEFLSGENVKRHVADPPAVWREAFIVNDGGLSYLAQSIAAVCDDRVKYRQIAAALDELRHGMQDRLRRYYVSENYAFQQDRRHTSGLLVVRRLKGASETRSFGHLLRALQLPESEFTDVLRNADVWTWAEARAPLGDTANSKANGSLNGAANGAVNGAVNGHHHDHGEDETAPIELIPDARTLARTAVDHWIESVRAIATSDGAASRFRLPRQALLHLVDELVVGAVRVGLDERIEQMIQRVTGGERLTADDLGRAAMCAANVIGDYVMTLGFNDLLANSHPRRKGKLQQPVFPPRNRIALSSIGEQENADDEYFADWSQAFLGLVGENASGLREREIAEDQNRRLGRLLRLLEVSL